MRPVSPLIPLRRTTVAYASGKARLSTGAGFVLASTDGPRSVALFGTVRAADTNDGSGLSMRSRGQYGTLAKNAIASAAAATVSSASRRAFNAGRRRA